MKRIAAISILTFMLFGVAQAEEHSTDHHAAPVQDQREAIVLTAAERNMILVEMRQFLVGVQAMIEALGKDDNKAAGEAARSMGRKAASEVAPELRAKLPMHFKMLGFGVHDQFDKMADLAAAGGNGKILLDQLGHTLNKCVACHATYQLPMER
ncbi:MAG: hypothetical protein AB1400_00840 [Pseudomonadota bacterium]